MTKLSNYAIVYKKLENMRKFRFFKMFKKKDPNEDDSLKFWDTFDIGFGFVVCVALILGICFFGIMSFMGVGYSTGKSNISTNYSSGRPVINEKGKLEVPINKPFDNEFESSLSSSYHSKKTSEDEKKELPHEPDPKDLWKTTNVNPEDHLVHWGSSYTVRVNPQAIY